MWARLAAYAGIVLAVFAAGWFSNGWRLESQRQAEQIAQDAANRKALAERDAEIQRVLGEYREKIAAVSNRRPKRVFCGPTEPLPGAAGGAPGASPAELDRHDYGPDLRAARDALIRCNTLINTVRSQP
jgi:hypothetical protein